VSDDEVIVVVSNVILHLMIAISEVYSFQLLVDHLSCLVSYQLDLEGMEATCRNQQSLILVRVGMVVLG